MSFDLVHILQNMTIINKGVIIILLLMSIYSVTVTIERFLFFNKARKQSLAFAKGVTGFLKNDNLQGAIDSSMKYPNSHVARVVASGAPKDRPLDRSPSPRKPPCRTLEPNATATRTQSPSR